MKPACMSDPEYDLWAAGNAVTLGRDQAVSPCGDCSLAFSVEMLKVGRCDGSPRGGRGRGDSSDPRILLRRLQWREAQIRKRAEVFA